MLQTLAHDRGLAKKRYPLTRFQNSGKRWGTYKYDDAIVAAHKKF